MFRKLNNNQTAKKRESNAQKISLDEIIDYRQKKLWKHGRYRPREPKIYEICFSLLSNKRR